MNTQKLALTIIFLFMVSLISCSQTRKELWGKDIHFLKTELAQKHKNLFFKISQEGFDQKLDNIIKRIDELEDIEIYIALQEIVASVGDDHTYIYDPKLPENGRFPIWLSWFDDGIYIMNTLPEYEDLLMKKLIAFNHIPIEKVVEKVLNVSSKTNPAVSKSHFLSYFSYKAILDYYDITDSELMLVNYINEKGDTLNITIKSIIPDKNVKQKWINPNLEKKALCEQNPEKFFWYHYDESKKVLYAQYNKCLSKEVIKRYGKKNKAKDYPSFNKFSSELIKILKNEDVEKFVFDMRYNGGGSSDIGTELVKKIAEIESINQKGKLFVIVGQKTFSSAILNSLDFQNMTNAIFVGEPTGGRPNHYGEMRNFTLPNSGIQVNYSTKYFTYAKEDTDSFYPDYEIKTSFKDYKNGVDPVYEWILNYK